MIQTVYDKGFEPLIDTFRKQRNYGAGLKVDLSNLLKSAEVFVLSPETALAAQKLTKSGARFPNVRDIMLPYDSVIVELPLTEEVRALRENEYSDPESQISRVAASICNLGSRNDPIIAFSPFWQFVSGKVEPSGVSFLMGNTNLAHHHLKIGTAQHATLDMDGGNLVADVVMSPIYLGLIRRIGVPDNKLPEIVATIQKNENLINDGFTEIPTLLFSWYMVMQCKSGVTRSKIDKVVGSSKFGGKLGARKAASKAVGAYTVISVTAVEEMTSEGIRRREGVHAHHVRGHFKRRASGIFWWNPFIRGDGTPKRRDAYIVKP